MFPRQALLCSETPKEKAWSQRVKALVPVGRERVPRFSSCSNSSYIIGKQAFPRPPGWSHSQFVVAKGSGGDE